MVERDQIIERVRKLRALGKSSNVHEAESAERRARVLMDKHGLTDADVMGASEADLGEWDVFGVDFAPDWRLGLLTATAMRYGCKAIRAFEGSRKATGAVVGPKAVSEVVIQIFRHFEGRVTEAMRKALEAEITASHEQHAIGIGSEIDDEFWKMDAYDQRIFADSFCRGATITLQDRILYGPMEVDIETLRKPAGELPKAPGAEAAPAGGSASLVKAPSKAATQALTRDYMASKPGVERFSGRSYAENRRAFVLGKRAGAEMKMPGEGEALPKAPEGKKP
jgi:hypothetical protein